MTNNEKLKKKYEESVNEYMRLFAKKHDMDIDYELEHGYLWMGSVGTICNICDMFVNFEYIRYDIDNDVPEEYFCKWYWTNLDRSEHGLKYMNYPSYCKGAPDPNTKEEVEHIKQLEENVRTARKILEEEIKKAGGDSSHSIFAV